MRFESTICINMDVLPRKLFSASENLEEILIRYWYIVLVFVLV